MLLSHSPMKRVIASFMLMGLIVVIYLLAQTMRLEWMGMRAQSDFALYQVFTSNLLHLEAYHIKGNMAGLIYMLPVMAFVDRLFVLSIPVIMVTTTILAYNLDPPGGLGLGASGIVFGAQVFIIVYGWVTNRFWIGLMGTGMFVGQWVMIAAGTLPNPNVPFSWAAHAGGALGGALMAVLSGWSRRV